MTTRLFLILLALTAAIASGPKTFSADRVFTPKPAKKVDRILPPLHPLPPESVSADATQFSFVVYGDTRGRRDGREIQYEHSLIVDSLLGTIHKLDKSAFPVRFVIQTGDAVVDGRDAAQWNSSFVRLINRITTEGGVPYFLAPGNHDVSSAEALNSVDRKKGLTNYLAAMAMLIPPNGASGRLPGYPTFSFGYGNSFFVAFDSNIASDETQYRWIRRQLESLDRRRFAHVFFFCHHPVFSSGPHGATIEAPTAELRKRYMPLCRKHHVDAIFAGHEHLFEHWVERYQDKSGRKYRLDEIVTGGGGAPLYGFKGEPDLSAYVKANAAEKVKMEHLVRPGMNRGETPYHYVVCRVNGDQLSVEVIGVDWGEGFAPYRSPKTELK